MVIEECRSLFETAAPGKATSTGWDRNLERDYARLDLIGTRTLKFAYLYTGRFTVDGARARSEVPGGVTLALYPGDTLTQARSLYGDAERVEALLDLRMHGWHLRPNFHFGFTAKGLCWTTSTLNIEAYVAYWVERIYDLHPYPRDDWDVELARLIADGIFSREDEAQFDADFRKTRRQEAYPRPTVAVSRSWDDAECRDSGFPSEVRAALRQVLSDLREPLTTLDRDQTAGQDSQTSTEPASRTTRADPISRERIPERVRHEVWRRDQGRCVDCGSRERLEFDHIIPISRGGSNTARNIELRCEVCNRKKAAAI